MDIIFSDFIIEANESDPTSPGVFIKVRKPSNFNEKDLSGHELYSIVLNKSCKNISDFDLSVFKAKTAVRKIVSRLLPAGVKASAKRMFS